MDDLQFRRQAYGDPNNQSDEFLAHLAENKDDAEFVKDLKAFDKKLTAALHIDVPNDLAEKLLLRQQLSEHQNSKKRGRYMMAMAASIAFVVGISVSLLRLTPINLSENSLAHVHHETKALIMEQDIGFNDVNFKLASVKGLSESKFIKQPGRVFYTSFCDFQGVKSLHLVMADELGNKVTLFIVPTESRMVLEEAFADNQFKGKSFQTADTYMILVGEPASDLEFVQNEVENTFI